MQSVITSVACLLKAAGRDSGHQRRDAIAAGDVFGFACLHDLERHAGQTHSAQLTMVMPIHNANPNHYVVTLDLCHPSCSVTCAMRTERACAQTEYVFGSDNCLYPFGKITAGGFVADACIRVGF